MFRPCRLEVAKPLFCTIRPKVLGFGFTTTLAFKGDCACNGFDLKYLNCAFKIGNFRDYNCDAKTRYKFNYISLVARTDMLSVLG